MDDTVMIDWVSYAASKSESHSVGRVGSGHHQSALPSFALINEFPFSKNDIPNSRLYFDFKLKRLAK